MTRSPVPFAQLFESILGAPPPFEIPDHHVLSSTDIEGVPHETMIGSQVGEPVLVQAQVPMVGDQPPGWFQAGFWGHGVNSEFVYYGRATERSTLFLRRIVLSPRAPRRPRGRDEGQRAVALARRHRSDEARDRVARARVLTRAQM